MHINFKQFFLIPLKTHIQLFTGIFLIACYIYFIFIFQRPFRSIPFTLINWNFFTLIILILLQIYFIYKILKSSTSSRILKRFIEDYLFWIMASLKLIDETIKSYHSINISYNKCLYFIIACIQRKSIIFYSIIILFLTAPRILLCAIFFLDIFYFHEIRYMYSIIWLTPLCYLNYYITYCLYNLIQNMIKQSEQNIESVHTTYVQGILPPEEDYWNDAYIEDEEENEEPPTKMRLSLKRFLDYRWSCIINNNNHQYDEFHCYITSAYHDKFIIEHKISEECYLNSEQRRQLYGTVEKEIDNIFQINKIIISFQNVIQQHLNNINIKNISLLLLWLYLLSWSYILIVSLPSLSIIDLVKTLLDCCRTLDNPFGGDILGFVNLHNEVYYANIFESILQKFPDSLLNNLINYDIDTLDLKLDEIL